MMVAMPIEPLTVEDRPDQQSGRRVLSLKGPLLISNLYEFQTKVRSNRSRSLIIDFSQVPYVDSAGIGALVGAQVTQQKEGCSLALVGVSERVRNALKVTHVEQFFKFFDSLPAAEEACA